MTVLSEDYISKRCVTAAFALCIVHTLTIVGTDYQIGWMFIHFLNSDDSFSAARFILVNYGTFLSPVILLLFVRKVCVLVLIIAIPVLIFFTWRMHHVWQFYWFGINSMARQKGDELGWATLAFEMLSFCIAAAWLTIIAVAKLLVLVEQVWRR